MGIWKVYFPEEGQTPADAKDELDRMISAAVEKSKENHQ